MLINKIVSLRLNKEMENIDQKMNEDITILSFLNSLRAIFALWAHCTATAAFFIFK